MTHARIKPAVLSSTYAVPWLLSVGVLVGAGVVTGVPNMAPLLGFLLAIPGEITSDFFR